MAFSGDDGELQAAINVTPLVDVMLVLLVIFMVTAPMMQQGVDVDLPRTSSTSMQVKEDPVVISLRKDGEAFIGDGNPIALESLSSKVLAILASRPPGDRKVFVKADSALPYGTVMELMGRLNEAGITQVGLVSQPPGSRSEVK